MGNMFNGRINEACSYSVPAGQAFCATAMHAIDGDGKAAGTWTVGHVATDGNRAIVDVIYENVCLGGRCTTNNDPNAGLPGSGTSFSTAFRQIQAKFNYATDCVRLNGRWYVDVVSGSPE